MWQPHLAFPTWPGRLCFLSLYKPEAVIKSVANSDVNHRSAEAYMTIFLTVLERTSSSWNILWENSHSNSPGEVMESTCIVLLQDLDGIFQEQIDNRGHNQSWLNFKNPSQAGYILHTEEKWARSWVFSWTHCLHAEQTVLSARSTLALWAPGKLRAE